MKKDSKKTVTLSDDDLIVARPMGRRSSMAMLGAGVLGAVGLVAGTPQQAEAQCSDRDPYDPAGRGRRCCSGVSDRDPHDPAGCGRRSCRGISDRDPHDPAGCGRRRCSDSDPHDPAGLGRHC
jgi:hypothetical protein